MTKLMTAICRRLGRRPVDLAELTPEERCALAEEAAETRSRPVERRG